MTKVAVLWVSMFALVTSAQSVRGVTKNGEVPSEREVRQDIAECRQQAFQEYPVAIVQTPTLPQSNGSTTDCYTYNGHTNCTTQSSGGVWGIPPSWVTGPDGRPQGEAYDANRDARRRAGLICMQLRGYADR